MRLQEYLTEEGESPFRNWFDDLNAPAAAKITTALVRLQRGITSRIESVGGGVLEYRIDFGPGYRIYFGRDGDDLVILVGGGTKKRQQSDIDVAKRRWEDYRQRKRGGR